MMTRKSGSEKTVRDIRRATRKRYSAEEKIRIVLDGLRGEESIAELCPREGINSNLYYRRGLFFWYFWPKSASFINGDQGQQ